MCYCTYELDDKIAKLCVIVTPYGKFCYCRVPMGIKQSPDFAKEIIEEVIRSLDVKTYIHNSGAFDNDWDSHTRWVSQQNSVLT
jgi:hypothetical protein